MTCRLRRRNFPKEAPSRSGLGHRTTASVPLLREGVTVGAITLRRAEVNPFTEKQIALLKIFADQAVIAIENVRLFDEVQARTRDLSESLQQQTATADVLKVISRSTFNLQTVLDTLVESAALLCEAEMASMNRQFGAAYRQVASYGFSPEFKKFMETHPVELQRGTTVARAIQEKKPVQIPDVLADKDFDYKEGAKVGGVRTVAAVPMLKGDDLIGVIAIYRREVRPFTDKQLDLVTTFADQAVIAIENVRLFDEVQARTRELTESLEQQTATTEILQVISSSQGELQPVFENMLENATRICEASFGNLLLYEGDAFKRVALHNAPQAWAADVERDPVVPRSVDVLYRIADTKQIVHVADFAMENPDAPIVRFAGARTVLVVPMLQDTDLIGAIGIYRQEVRPFTEKQVELVSNFAAQAVIAIENTRLLNELRESLQQQTATADVLKVISRSPGDLQPVFQAMLENAVSLCEATFGNLFLYDGEEFRIAALHHASAAYAEARRRNVVVRDLHPDVPLSRLARTKEVVHIADARTQQSYIDHDPTFTEFVDVTGTRTLLEVPMLQGRTLIGAIVIYRHEVRPFSEKQIELVAGFANQAVIAIENTRLLNELRQRTTDLSELLEQQTATSEVLGVISSSPGELKPVFEAMLANATRICEARFGNLLLYEGDAFRVAAMHGAPEAWNDLRQRDPLLHFSPNNPLGRVAATKQLQHVADFRLEETYLEREPGPVALVEAAGARTVLVVPMVKENELIGALAIYRQEVRPFNDKQIALVSNFAAQAVIAIESTRLLNELRESLQQQTATADVLKVISRSTFDLQAVLDTLVQSAARLCEADGVMIGRPKGETYYFEATYGISRQLAEFLAHNPARIDRGSMFLTIESALLPCWTTFSRLLFSIRVSSLVSSRVLLSRAAGLSTSSSSSINSADRAEKLLTKLSGFLISCAMPAVSCPRDASFSV